MSDPSSWHRALDDAETRLQRAQAAGDVDALDALLDDALIATLAPSQELLDKPADLAAHRERRLVVARSDEIHRVVRVTGPTGVTRVVIDMAGTFEGRPFASRMVYTRTWHHASEGWRVIAAHISPAQPAGG